MDVLRTPEDRFRDLPSFAYPVKYADVDPNLRMAYVDEGPRDGRVVLMLHGEPSWSFLYRKMIPVFVEKGFRAIAPDLIGFGRSDKPTRQSDYTYARHVAWTRAFIESANLRNVTLFAQDWGSLIGLRVAMENQDRFARIVIGNGYLPTADRPVPNAFRIWRAFATYSPVFPIGRVVASGCVTKLNANRAAWKALGQWEKPFLTLFGKNDPILGRADKPLQAHVPGARGQPHERFWGGHFVQEDRGDYIATQMVKWLG